jgi:Uma2 family endonuclease
MNEMSRDEGAYTSERYFDLVRVGDLRYDDHVELLDGVIVAEPPQEPRHASSTTYVYEALHAALRGRALIRVQMPFVAGRFSVPEPDVAVVPGRASDYESAHPTTALLIVEVAESSLPQDRLTKTRIYAGAAVPEYWVVNLRDGCVEVFQAPDPQRRTYARNDTVRAGGQLSPLAFPDVSIAVSGLLPVGQR